MGVQPDQCEFRLACDQLCELSSGFRRNAIPLKTHIDFDEDLDPISCHRCIRASACRVNYCADKPVVLHRSDEWVVNDIACINENGGINPALTQPNSVGNVNH